MSPAQCVHNMKNDTLTTSDMWSSIFFAKNNEDSSSSEKQLLPPPYVHPLVKRSANKMSEKSLETCTESLGSETGSDSSCFNRASNSPPYPHNRDMDKNNQHQHSQQQQEDSLVSQPWREDFPLKNYTNSSSKKSPRCFPPPIASVHMQSSRQNGRLIVEALSAPPNNASLHAQRLDGRLLLTYTNDHHAEKVSEFDLQGFDDNNNNNNDNTGTWPNNSISSMMGAGEAQNIKCYTTTRPPSFIPLILSPPLKVIPTSPASFNIDYDIWRNNTTIYNHPINIIDDDCHQYYSSTNDNNNNPLIVTATTTATDLKGTSRNDQLVLIRGNKLAPTAVFTSCKNLMPITTSLIIWEPPYCIATS